jgi:type I restriction enzyme S subunit
MSKTITTELGEVPTGWTVKLIDDLKSSKKNAIAMGPFGSNIKSDNFVSSGVPVVRGNNLNGYHFLDDNFVYLTEEKSNQLKASQCFPRDILITHRGTIGQVGIIPDNSKYKKYIISQSGLKITLDRDIVDEYFVFYFLKSQLGQHLLLRNKSQTGVPAIGQPTTSVKSIPVPIPPLEESRKIGQFFFNLDSKILNLKKQNKLLEKIAVAVFSRWFEEFDFPDKNGKPYLSSGGKVTQINGEEVPIGWEFSALKNEFSITMGQSPPGSSYNEDQDGDIFYQGRAEFGFRFPRPRLYTTRGKRFAEESDVLLSVRAPVGDINIASERCCIGRGLAAINSRYPSYCYYRLKSLSREFNLFESEGTVFGAINKQSLEQLTYLQSGVEIIENFEKLISPIDLKIKNNWRYINLLENLKDTLIPKVVLGEIRV